MQADVHAQDGKALRRKRDMDGARLRPALVGEIHDERNGNRNIWAHKMIRQIEAGKLARLYHDQDIWIQCDRPAEVTISFEALPGRKTKVLIQVSTYRGEQNAALPRS